MMSNELFVDFIDWFGLNKDKFEDFKLEKTYNEKIDKIEITITAKLPVK